jgi:hypothetical protein
MSPKCFTRSMASTAFEPAPPPVLAIVAVVCVMASNLGTPSDVSVVDDCICPPLLG